MKIAHPVRRTKPRGRLEILARTHPMPTHAKRVIGQREPSPHDIVRAFGIIIRGHVEAMP